MKKKIIKIKGDNETIEYKECNPRKLPLTLKYLAPYWHQAIQNVNSYEKRRDFAESHKLLSDDRIKKGLELYKDKKILQSTITTESGGDVHAVVQSESSKKQYRVIVKDYLPKKPPQYIHEREEYIANLRLMCNCDDHIIGRYKDNASICCKHINSVIFFLIDRFNMPKILIKPEERTAGWRKSKIVELETEIRAMPLVKFSQHLNILLMKQYRDMNPAMAFSVHRIDNKTNKELNKPQWLTFTDEAGVRRILRGVFKSYLEISKKKEEEIFNEIGGDIIKTLRERVGDIEAKFKKEQKEINENIVYIAEKVKETNKDMLTITEIETLKERLDNFDKFKKEQKKDTEEVLAEIANSNMLIKKLQKTMEKTNNTMNNNYTNLKDNLEKVKSNFWLTLFGVK